jgi:hypothetical protein
LIRSYKAIFRRNNNRFILIRVNQFPKFLLGIKKFKSLEIDFIDKIDIPDDFKDVEIENLILSGKIDEAGIKRIKGLFPNTDVIINIDNKIKIEE